MVLYPWMGCGFLVLGIQLQRMAPVVNPGADSETGRIRKEAKRKKVEKEPVKEPAAEPKNQEKKDNPNQFPDWEEKEEK